MPSEPNVACHFFSWLLSDRLRFDHVAFVDLVRDQPFNHFGPQTALLIVLCAPWHWSGMTHHFISTGASLRDYYGLLYAI
jgi:hypothetical protein